MKKVTLIMVICALLSAPVLGGLDVVAYWAQNDNGLPVSGFGFQPGDFPQAADLGAGVLTVGGGDLNATVVNSNGVTVYQWVQSFAGTTVNAQPSYAGGGSIAIQNGTGGVNNGSYIQFAIDMTGYEDLAISYAVQRTSTGFTSQTWSYSADGANFTDFQTVNDMPSSFATRTLTTLTALDDVENALIRVTFSGGSTSAATGNNRMDNLTFQAVAIPEPATLALLGFGALTMLRRRK